MDLSSLRMVGLATGRDKPRPLNDSAKSYGLAKFFVVEFVY